MHQVHVPASNPYITIDQSWDDSNAVWTSPTASPPSGAAFVVYRRRRSQADSERVFTLVQFVDRTLLDSIRNVCPTLDGLYTHEGMVALNLLFPHIDKFRGAPNAVGLSAFLEFIEDEFQPHRKRIAALSAEGQTKYEYLWTIYKPGTELAICVDGNDDFIGAIVESAEYLSANPGPYFLIKYRTLKWTGETMLWATWSAALPPFEGYDYIATLGPHLMDDERRARLTESGRQFVRFVGNGGIHHVQLTGNIILSAGQEVSAIGYGMVDPVMYTKFFPARRATMQFLHPLEHPPEQEDTLWLMPNALECYAFASHTWGMVRVSDILPIAHGNPERAWSRLAISEEHKRTIRALVEGKPPAVIFLHGPSCTGKTFTVEALAAALRRPVYFLGGAEFGTTSLNSSIYYTLEAAERWKAIMLLEDANDHSAGPERLQLVEWLLRALHERKDRAPPLFMTTRRMHFIGATMLHRITLAVEYTLPDFMQRLKLWEQYIDDVLESAPRDELLLLARSKDKPIMHSENMRELATKPFNATDIQGLVQSAHALAVSQQEPLSIRHFREFIYAKEKFLRDMGMIITPDEVEEEEDEEGSAVTEADQ